MLSIRDTNYLRYFIGLNSLKNFSTSRLADDLIINSLFPTQVHDLRITGWLYDPP